MIVLLHVLEFMKREGQKQGVGVDTICVVINDQYIPISQNSFDIVICVIVSEMICTSMLVLFIVAGAGAESASS